MYGDFFDFFDLFDPNGPDFGFVDQQTDRTDEGQAKDMVPIGEMGEEDNLLEEEDW